MSLLPIVERELRAAARRRSTYRVRSWTALLASLVGFVFLTFIWLTSGGSRAGELLLGVLTAFAAGLSLLTGVFLTSDCISQEKREGTLGLLFLTPLKGYDVVLGKFMAMSVNALYGLLALLPILSLSLLLGGVTGEEFFRTALALVNTLFFSLTAGIWISTLARDSRTAMFGTFGLVLLVFAGLPALHRLLPVAAQSWSWLGSVSPFYPFSYVGEASYYSHGAKYWGTLLASHLLGWAFLGSASWLLPRLWQEKSAADFGSGAGRWRTRAGASATTRAKRRAELLPLSPVLWLVGGEPLLRWVIWAIIACWACVVLAGVSLHSTDPAWIIYGAKPCGFVLKMLVASQACRFFAESRRTGALELLL
jgi:ABC-type transport system involved in multi-copper enzyme maturation permease subunit